MNRNELNRTDIAIHELRAWPVCPIPNKHLKFRARVQTAFGQYSRPRARMNFLGRVPFKRRWASLNSRHEEVLSCL